MKDTILEEAQNITDGARKTDYGDARKSFSKIARVASELTNKELTAVDIAIIFKCVKLVRESNGHKRDNLVDEVGYARLESILKGDEDEDDKERTDN